MKKTIQDLQFDVQEFSDNTFGKHRISLPIINHLEKEVKELQEVLKDYYKGSYSDLEEYNKKVHNIRMEFADCLTLLLDAAAHLQLTTDNLISASYEKLEINKKRKWGKADENGVIEHIRD